MSAQHVLSQSEISELRQKLLVKKGTLSNTEKSIQDEALNGMSMATTDEISHARMHAADLGSQNEAQSVLLGIAEGQIHEIQEIEDALERMNRGIYGYCEGCEEEIAFARLSVQPEARYCIKCAREFEKERKEADLIAKTPDANYFKPIVEAK